MGIGTVSFFLFFFDTVSMYMSLVHLCKNFSCAYKYNGCANLYTPEYQTLQDNTKVFPKMGVPIYILTSNI